MQHSTRYIEFDSSTGVQLRGRIVVPDNTRKPHPVVFMMTGDGPRGSKSETWSIVPDRLAREGIASFLFDFEGLGFSDGLRVNLSLSVGLRNAAAAMEALHRQTDLDPERVGIFAASFGGNVAVLLSDSRTDIKCLGLKSPVSFYPDSFASEFGDALLDKWGHSGLDELIGFRYQFYVDAFAHNTYGAALNVRCPTLITHGDSDNVVPIRQSKHLRAAIAQRSKCDLHIFERVGHQYAEPGAWEKMSALFIRWFMEQLL